MHLFVYGTLLSGIPSSMSKFLTRNASLIGKATVTGTLFDLGMYPGFVTSGNKLIHGEIYELNAADATTTMEMLDAYEGVTGEQEDEYKREKISCQTTDGKAMKAYTYISKTKPGSAPEISSGDYQKFYRGNKEHQRFVNGG